MRVAFLCLCNSVHILWQFIIHNGLFNSATSDFECAQGSVNERSYPTWNSKFAYEGFYWNIGRESFCIFTTAQYFDRAGTFIIILWGYLWCLTRVWRKRHPLSLKSYYFTVLFLFSAKRVNVSLEVLRVFYIKRQYHSRTFFLFSKFIPTLYKSSQFIFCDRYLSTPSSSAKNYCSCNFYLYYFSICYIEKSQYYSITLIFYSLCLPPPMFTQPYDPFGHRDVVLCWRTICGVGEKRAKKIAVSKQPHVCVPHICSGSHVASQYRTEFTFPTVISEKSLTLIKTSLPPRNLFLQLFYIYTWVIWIMKLHLLTHLEVEHPPFCHSYSKLAHYTIIFPPTSFGAHPRSD